MQKQHFRKKSLLETTDNVPFLAGPFHAGQLAAHLFSKTLNWQDFDPSYPNNRPILGEYIRKFSKDKGRSKLGALREGVLGTGCSLFTKMPGRANIGHESPSQEGEMKKKEIRRCCTGMTEEEVKKEIKAFQKGKKTPRSAISARGPREPCRVF